MGRRRQAAEAGQRQLNRANNAPSQVPSRRWPAGGCYQQYVHYWSRPSRLRLTAELVRGQFLELDWAPDRCPDDVDLLGLTEGFGAGKDVVASRMAIVI